MENPDPKTHRHRPIVAQRPSGHPEHLTGMGHVAPRLYQDPLEEGALHGADKLVIQVLWVLVSEVDEILVQQSTHTAFEWE